MKILWFTNVPLPEFSNLINKKPTVYGGWLIKLAESISLCEDIELDIAFPFKTNKRLLKVRGSNIEYYAFTPIKDIKMKKLRKYNIIDEILTDSKPDLVHIHGTEYIHSAIVQKLCTIKAIETVISIQGIVSVISKHMTANLPNKIIVGKSIRNLLLGDNIKGMIKRFRRQGYNEIEVIRQSKFVIGRTLFDYAFVKQINPKIEYFKCNEILRDPFYKDFWNINDIEEHSIFISQGSYSVKGLHNMIEALYIIKESYKDVKLYVGGKNLVDTSTIKNKLLRTYYGKYIYLLIKKYKLLKNVIFLGSLNETEIHQRFLKSHVFVCPSLIENSPNSLGEAMILGVPCVASFVGGIPSILKHESEGYLYQHDAVYMLAYYIMKIFSSNDDALFVSMNARKRALQTHSPIEIVNNTISVYKKISENKFKE